MPCRAETEDEAGMTETTWPDLSEQNTVFAGSGIVPRRLSLASMNSYGAQTNKRGSLAQVTTCRRQTGGACVCVVGGGGGGGAKQASFKTACRVNQVPALRNCVF